MKLWFQKHKRPVLWSAVLVLVLAAAWWFGGNTPGAQGWSARSALSPSASSAAVSSAASPAAESASPSSTVQSGLLSRPGGADGEKMTAAEKEAAAAQYGAGAAAGTGAQPSGGTSVSTNSSAPSSLPAPVDNAAVTDKEETCTISISCAAILAHPDWLDSEKTELVPENGVLLAPVSVTFYEGESVFNVLQRVCRQNGIHMEFENVPLYNSAYIEGISNLYEFDCGELSGWMYRVNGVFPNYGCSRYALKNGDTIDWVYTCTLGADVGGTATAGNGKYERP